MTAMNDIIKKYYKTVLFFALVGLVGGFFTGIYLLDSYPEQIKQQLIDELKAFGIGNFPINIFTGIITAIQSAGYGLILGCIGIYFSKRIGLWRDGKRITRNPLIITAVLSIVGGILLILPDIFFFGKYSETIMESYSSKPSLVFILASITYGAVIEEVMLRLFFMSLLAFIIHKLIYRSHEATPKVALVFANIIAALLFAVGHLPATFILLGSSPLIILRCILLNGIFGLLFGFLYRKYGLIYAMLAHGGCHIVSKLIWLIFI